MNGQRNRGNHSLPITESVAQAVLQTLAAAAPRRQGAGRRGAWWLCGSVLPHLGLSEQSSRELRVNWKKPVLWSRGGHQLPAGYTYLPILVLGVHRRNGILRQCYDLTTHLAAARSVGISH